MFALFMIGCDLLGGNPGDSGGQACTEMAAASLTLEVLDPQGGAVLDASVHYSVDGSDPTVCDAWGNGTYVCGYEVAGELTVTVEAEGYLDAQTVATVVMDDVGCHVIGQTASLTLEADSIGCDESLVYSAAVTLQTIEAKPLDNPKVEWSLANADMAPQPCDGAGYSWSCGEEVAGDLEIWASADGYPVVREEVTVEMTADECHVVTEFVDITLEAVTR